MSVSLVSDANDEIKMSSKLNAESIGDWACTMANGIKGETVTRERERESEGGGGSPPLSVLSSCRLCALACYWSHIVQLAANEHGAVTAKKGGLDRQNKRPIIQLTLQRDPDLLREVILNPVSNHVPHFFGNCLSNISQRNTVLHMTF